MKPDATKKNAIKNKVLSAAPLRFAACAAVAVFAVLAPAAGGSAAEQPAKVGPAFSDVEKPVYRKPAPHFIIDDSLKWFPHAAQSGWRGDNTLINSKPVERQAGGLVLKVREHVLPGAKPPFGVWFTLFRPVHGQGHVNWNIEPGPVCLGTIRPVPMLPGEHSLGAERTRWGANRLTFNYVRTLLNGQEQDAEFSITVSRLTPALLVESDAEMVVFFAGAPETPRHTARMEAGKVVLHTFDEGEVLAAQPLSWEAAVSKDKVEDLYNPGFYNECELNSPEWMLVWFGAKGSYFYASQDGRWLFDYYNRGGSGEGHMIGVEKAQHGLTAPADMPFLLVFEHPPLSMCVVEGGGIRFSFAETAGRIVLHPLFGEDLPASGEIEGWQGGLTHSTAGWAAKLPDAVREKCEWWARRLRQFPLDVEERAKYDAASDELTLEYRFTYEPVGDGGEKFAPVPPMLALAAEMGFPAKVPDPAASGYYTQCGPYIGIDGADSVAVRMSGLGKYAREGRCFGSGACAAKQKLEAQLAQEVQRTLAAGRLAPALYHCWPTPTQFGSAPSFVWDRPGETVWRLAEAMDFLPAELAVPVREYLKAEQSVRPSEMTVGLAARDGARREPYRLDTRMPLWGWEMVWKNASDYRQDIIDMAEYVAEHNDYYRAHKLVPPDALYALAEYARRAPDAQINWQAARAAMDAHDARRDWATLGFVKRTPLRSTEMYQGGGRDASAVEKANEYLTGCIGLVRLARIFSDAEAEQEAFARFYLAAAHRFAVEEYVQWLYKAGLLRLPPDFSADWLLKSFSGAWSPMHGFMVEYRPELDPRRIEKIDEMCLTLRLPRGYQMPTAGAAAPEVGRFLNELLGDKLRARAAAVYEPAEWFVWNCGGYEPKKPLDNSRFLFHAWVLGATPEQLALWTGAPWATAGDWAYIQRLVEALAACRGVEWREWGK